MVQIWQRSNWHWYLKREMRALGSGRIFTAWHEEGSCLSVLTSEGLCSEVRPPVRRTAVLMHVGTGMRISGVEWCHTNMQCLAVVKTCM